LFYHLGQAGEDARFQSCTITLSSHIIICPSAIDCPRRPIEGLEVLLASGFSALPTSTAVMWGGSGGEG
jgi:hypothetical protein